MVDAVQLRPAASAVVRPLTRAAERPCARPGCPAPARATLTFRYASREAWLGGLADEPAPQAYDLCVPHASRTSPPRGWELRDRRPEEERELDVPPATPADLGGERTVAVLAAALRQVPDATPARDVRNRAAEVVPDPATADAAPTLEPTADAAPTLEPTADAAPTLEPASAVSAATLRPRPTPAPTLESAPAAPAASAAPRPVLAARRRRPATVPASSSRSAGAADW